MNLFRVIKNTIHNMFKRKKHKKNKSNIQRIEKNCNYNKPIQNMYKDLVLVAEENKSEKVANSKSDFEISDTDELIEIKENSMDIDNAKIEIGINIQDVENQNDVINSIEESIVNNDIAETEYTELVTASKDVLEESNDIETTEVNKNSTVAEDMDNVIGTSITDIKNQIATVSSTNETKEDSALSEKQENLVTKSVKLISDNELENVIEDNMNLYITKENHFENSDFDYFEKTIDSCEDNDNKSETTPVKIILDENDLSFTYDEVQLSQNDFLETIEILKNKLNKNQLIGYDLLQIAGNKEDRKSVV